MKVKFYHNKLMVTTVNNGMIIVYMIYNYLKH